MQKFVASIILIAFTASCVVPSVHAQSVVDLPQPGTMLALSPSFSPVVLRGIKVDPEDPFRFDFLVDPGDSGLTGDALKAPSSVLIKYFLAAVTTPEKDLWVNLSPYEKDRIVPDAFGRTEMGRDLLSQDYILKQITASLVYPETGLGKDFWQKIYQRAFEQYGTTDIAVDTFNKVWIMPESADVYEDRGVAYIGESHLKIMLDADHTAMDQKVAVEGLKAGAIGRDVFREVIIPVIEKEVNEGRNFAQLRQVYQSLILAAWYKHRLKESILNSIYADKNKVAGSAALDREDVEKIYAQYIEAFRKGVYNYVKDEYDTHVQETLPRKYFSGGFKGQGIYDQAMSFKPLVNLKVWAKGLFQVSACAIPSESESGGGILLNVPRVEKRGDGNEVKNAQDDTPGRVYDIYEEIASRDGKALKVSRDHVLGKLKYYDTNPAVLWGKLAEGVAWAGLTGLAGFGVWEWIKMFSAGAFLPRGVVICGVCFFLGFEVYQWLIPRIQGYQQRQAQIIGNQDEKKIRIFVSPDRAPVLFFENISHEIAHELELPNDKLLANAYADLVLRHLKGAAVIDDFRPRYTLNSGTVLSASQMSYFLAEVILKVVPDNLPRQEVLLRSCFDPKRKFFGALLNKYGKGFTQDQFEREAGVFIRTLAADKMVAVEHTLPRAEKEELWMYNYGIGIAKLAWEHYGNAWDALQFIWKLGETLDAQSAMDQVDVSYQSRGQVEEQADRAAALKGGIDLGTHTLDLKVRGDGSVVMQGLDPAQWQAYQNAAGFSPVIINIIPVHDVPAFLGLS